MVFVVIVQELAMQSFVSRSVSTQATFFLIFFNFLNK